MEVEAALPWVLQEPSSSEIVAAPGRVLMRAVQAENGRIAEVIEGDLAQDE